MTNELLPVYLAYSLVCLGIFLYLFHIDRRQRALRKELEELRRRSGRDGG